MITRPDAIYSAMGGVFLRTRGFINAFWLKLIMVVLMVLDHLYYKLFPDELLFGHYLARVVAPVFTFFMAEGMYYTRNRLRYVLRIAGFGLVMAGGNLILFALCGVWVRYNILFSLALGAAVIFCIDRCRTDKQPLHKVIWALATTLLFAVSFYCEGQYLVPLMAIIFYYLREKPLIMHIVFIIATGLPFIVMFLQTGVLQVQFYMVFSFIPILMYNGERGPNNAFAKYFFYIFYPVHIWIIFLLEQAGSARM